MGLFLKVQKLQENFKTIQYVHVSREEKFQIMVDEILNEELENRGYKKYNKK